MIDLEKNVDPDVAEGFGLEWSIFTQVAENFSGTERQDLFDSYFGIFPWEKLPAKAVGMDVGCGSGRWAAMVAPRVGHLHLLDASSEALAVARANLSESGNTTFHLASAGDIRFRMGRSTLPFRSACFITFPILRRP